jgi:hypothetical protein
MPVLHYHIRHPKHSILDPNDKQTIGGISSNDVWDANDQVQVEHLKPLQAGKKNYAVSKQNKLYSLSIHLILIKFEKVCW